MEKNNNSLFMRIGSIMCAVALVLTGSICGTMAKYTSSSTRSDVGTVAKWEVTVENDDITDTTADSWSFDLFATAVKDTDGTSTEADVASNKIAPGTSGSFTVDIKNESEVDATYTVALTETNASNVPLQYSVDNTTWKDSVTELTMTSLTNQALEMGASATATVYWRWSYEGTTTGAHASQTDTSDTTLGVAAQSTAPTVTIEATVTVTQVD